MAVQESRAKEFLSGLRRPKRQLWDRSRPEVQQWYQHFLYLGFDEAVGVGVPQLEGRGLGERGRCRGLDPLGAVQRPGSLREGGTEGWLPTGQSGGEGQKPESS